MVARGRGQDPRRTGLGRDRVADHRPGRRPDPGVLGGQQGDLALATLARDTPEIARITRDAGLQLSGLGGYARCDNHDDVETLLVATAALGARQVRVTVPRVGQGNYREAFALAREHFEWVTDRAVAHGVKALVELHGTLTASASASASASSDGRTTTVVERLVSSAGRDHWGASHSVLIDNFYARLGDSAPFWIGPVEAAKSLKIIQDLYAYSETAVGLDYPGAPASQSVVG